MPVLFLAIALLLCAPAVVAREDVVPAAARAAAERIHAEQLARDLKFLASDELAGRNTPSAGFDKAADYIAARLTKAGLKPLGDDGSFFQRYTMRESQADTSSAFLEVGGQRFSFGAEAVLRTFAEGVSGPLPVVYVGHGWTVPAKGIDPYAGLDLKGKLVVAHGPRALPKGVEIRQIGRISVGAGSPLAEASARGAAAVLFIPSRAGDDAPESREQNPVRRELVPSVPSAYAAAPVTSVLLGRKAAAALLAGERVEAADIFTRAEAQDYPASFQLGKQATLHVPVSSSIDHRPYNVVALLEGSDPRLKSEYVTVESHLDGAVGTREVDGDAVYNSADDNASGSAATLSMAEQMAAGPRPKRSIVFIWDSGEERGLWGTRYFVHAPPVPLEQIVAHVNVDMIGANRAAGSADASESRVTGANEVFVIGPRVLSERADALLERVNAGYLRLQFNRDHDRADSEFFYPRTDAGPFLERRILTIGFTTGIHDRYHLPSDEARFLDPSKMEAIARTVLVSVWALADAADRPGIDRPVPVSVPDYRQPRS